MFLFVYSSYHLKVIFSASVIVFLTALETPKYNLVLLYSRNFTAGIEGHYNEHLDCSGYPQNPFLNQAALQENTCQIFQPKKSRNRQFHTPQNLVIIPVT